MAFKYSKGKRGFGDITFEDDSDTGIDFEQRGLCSQKQIMSIEKYSLKPL